MNLTKKQMMIAAIVIGAVAVWYFFIRKKKMESSYDEDLLIFGNENGYGPDYGAYGSYGYETGYGPDFGAYGSFGYETGYAKDKPYRMGDKNDPNTSKRNTRDDGYVGQKLDKRATVANPGGSKSYGSAYDGSNAGQICHKDRHCSPGLVCINGRCREKKRDYPTGGVKPTANVMPTGDIRPASSTMPRVEMAAAIRPMGML